MDASIALASSPSASLCSVHTRSVHSELEARDLLVTAWLQQWPLELISGLSRKCTRDNSIGMASHQCKLAAIYGMIQGFAKSILYLTWLRLVASDGSVVPATRAAADQNTVIEFAALDATRRIAKGNRIFPKLRCLLNVTYDGCRYRRITRAWLS